MERLEEIIIGQALVNLKGAVSNPIVPMTDFQKAIADGIGAKDGRFDERKSYENSLQQLIHFLINEKGMNYEMLIKAEELYKVASVLDVITAKNEHLELYKLLKKFN